MHNYLLPFERIQPLEQRNLLWPHYQTILQHVTLNGLKMQYYLNWYNIIKFLLCRWVYFSNIPGKVFNCCACRSRVTHQWKASKHITNNINNCSTALFFKTLVEHWNKKRCIVLWRLKMLTKIISISHQYLSFHFFQYLLLTSKTFPLNLFLLQHSIPSEEYL